MNGRTHYCGMLSMYFKKKSITQAHSFLMPTQSNQQTHIDIEINKFIPRNGTTNKIVTSRSDNL